MSDGGSKITEMRMCHKLSKGLYTFLMSRSVNMAPNSFINASNPHNYLIRVLALCDYCLTNHRMGF